MPGTIGAMVGKENSVAIDVLGNTAIKFTSVPESSIFTVVPQHL
jgi:hypothetical protein